MKIVVLAGGLSPERDVSLSSGSLIANALMEIGHRVLLLDLYKGIELCGPADGLFRGADSGRFDHVIPQSEPDLEKLKAEADMGEVLIGKNVLEICGLAELVFIALHGSIGENGKLQAVFDTCGIRYTGTGYIGSLLAMDKDLSKQLMRCNGILTPDWLLFHAQGGNMDEITGSVGFPCVVKPCSCGSSIGVSIVRGGEELRRAVAAAGAYEDILLVEKMVAGREFSVGILDGEALPPIEIIPNEGFYDYAHKYQKGFAEEICPARLPEEISRGLQSAALRVHQVLRLGDYSRIDFILDSENNAFCLEANTLPGMTPTSLLPQEAAAAGISYGELCDKIASMPLRGRQPRRS